MRERYFGSWYLVLCDIAVYEGESVNWPQMDIKRKTCDI
jgi:hypothetical protein